MYSLLISVLVSFIVSFVMTPKVIAFLEDSLIVGEDVQKEGKPRLATSGGVCFTTGILAGIFTYITINTFLLKKTEGTIQLLAIVSSILIALFIGLFDDIGVRIKNGRAHRVGLTRSKKILLTLPAAVPLMAIKAGETAMMLPIIGRVDIGLLFPLVFIPLGVVGCTNMVNMFAGFNGSEAGMGVMYLSSIAYFAYARGANFNTVVICACTVAAILGYLKYNIFPAKVLPGDSTTYTLGSIAAATIMIGNMEKAGIIILFPFIVEGILKFRSLIETGEFAKSVGKLGKNGVIISSHKKIYSIAHILQKFKLTEKQIATYMILIAAVFAVIPHLIW